MELYGHRDEGKGGRQEGEEGRPSSLDPISPWLLLYFLCLTVLTLCVELPCLQLLASCSVDP